MKKIYIPPFVYVFCNEELLDGFEDVSPPGDTERGTSKRNVFVFSDDSNILPTVSMDD